MALQIDYISKKSIFYKYGIRKGDLILSINNRAIYNFDGVIYETQFEKMKLLFKTKKDILIEKVIHREDYDKINIYFKEKPLKVCRNKCVFCFIDQNPKNLRKNLYVKDDDYRMSIAYGNFITLTNISEEELNDIVEHEFSPLYISIHSVNKKIRKKIFGRETGIENLLFLLKNKIKIHAQIVLIPGINDNEVLEETLLFAKKHKFLSVGIVPCGLTGHREKLYKIKPLTKKYAIKTIDFVEEWKKKNKYKKVYLADEFFISAKRDIPKNSYYHDFCQIENGIGLVRDFLNVIKDFKNYSIKEEYTLLTGESFGNYLIENNIFQGKNIIPVKNTFFGGHVNVTGLLTAHDLINIKNKIKTKNILLYNIIFNQDKITLDNYTKKDIEKAMNKKIFIINEYVELRSYLNVNN